MIPTLLYCHRVSRRVSGSSLWPDCLHPEQAAQAERGRTPKVGSYTFSILLALYLLQQVNLLTPFNLLFLIARQRKVRREILNSPMLPERGRSRSREAYPQAVRAGSRGRSLSLERRGSRNSSDSSLADMDERAKTRFRYWDCTGNESSEKCLSYFNP